ncbi:hypothetical protein B9N62_06275 [Campylobacter concisus]|uniref:YopX protein domain-containing protein n=1 Tax=Campylobacter concisus TaxID=199 RepID=A0A1Y5MTA1_9BACT|nr:YopX family protein [Campylobacter concisus]OUT11589.1 hypothetical protein B9N62_06275 [Campylobacter concisus]
MREIEFRAYVYDLTDKDSHPLEIDVRAGKLWDVVSINFKDQIVEIMDDDGNVWEYGLNDEIALVQYTGLKDQNGRKIYEGNIVRFCPQAPRSEELPNPQDGEMGEVFFDIGSFAVRPIDRKREVLEFFLDELGEWVVVGNIYKNKELLDE